MTQTRTATFHCLLSACLACTLASLSPFHHPIQAGDWPQILGPGRDGKAVDETIAPWDEEPPIRWRIPCGAGYAGVAVAQNKVFLWHREGDQELLDCLSTQDGQRLWRAALPAVYRGGVDPDLGPRSVPLVMDNQVIVNGAAGDLSSVSIADGSVRWSRQLRSDYDAGDGYFGAGSSPIAVGSALIIPVGGSSQSGLVAVNARDGKTRWTAVEQEAAYASPVRIQIAGQTRVVAVLRLQTVMIDPENGNVLSRFDFGQRGPTVNAATPLVENEQLLVTASYGVGCRMMDMTQNPPKNLWESGDVISSHYTTPVHIGAWLYAITGREDYGAGELLCVGWSDGKIAWRRPGYGTAHLVGVGERVLALAVSGRLELIAADDSAYRSLATAGLPAGIYRALPALSEGILYCRRSISPTDGELFAIDLN